MKLRLWDQVPSALGKTRKRTYLVLFAFARNVRRCQCIFCMNYISIFSILLPLSLLLNPTHLAWRHFSQPTQWQNYKLNWKDHVTFVCRKVARGLDVIIKVWKVLRNESLISITRCISLPNKMLLSLGFCLRNKHSTCMYFSQLPRKLSVFH